MAKLTLIEAARLYGKSRSTLYRHARKGKLSAEKRTRGDRDTYVVDMAELVRAYGEPPAGDVAGDGASSTPATPGTALLQAEIVALTERLAASQREVADKGEQLAAERELGVWLRGQVEATQRLLTDRRIVGAIRRVLVGDKP